jgi:hypothetical protein
MIQNYVLIRSVQQLAYPDLHSDHYYMQKLHFHIH